MSKNNLEGLSLVKIKEAEKKIKAKDLENVLLVAIRIRGSVKKRHEILKTFELLKLHKKNHATLLQATKSINGMLFKVKDFIAYGMIEKSTLVKLLSKKARLKGNKPLDLKSLKVLANFDSYDDFADALLDLKIQYKDLKNITPIFRLHPPKGGFLKGIKKQFTQGGVLGFQGNNINKLLERMI
ncbi:MAG: 50S ribosomal protein L30 [Promethearchaeota archaeon]